MVDCGLWMEGSFDSLALANVAVVVVVAVVAVVAVVVVVVVYGLLLF